MKHSLFLALVIIFQVASQVQLQRVQSRHYRPLEDRCERNGRCPSKDGYLEETDPQDAKNSRDEDRYPTLTRDDYSPSTENGRPRDGSDLYKPKPAYNRDDYAHKNVEEGFKLDTGSDGGHLSKPTIDEYDSKVDRGKPDSREDYRPAIRPKPPRGVGGYLPHPVDRPVRVTDYDRKPEEDKLGYPSGPSGGHNPKHAVHGDDHLSRPTATGYDTKRDDIPKFGGGGYNPGPVRDLPQPIGSGGYKLRPADDIPKFGGGGYHPIPPRDNPEDYVPKPAGSGGYKLNPEDTPKVGSGGYPSHPVRDNPDYFPKPIGSGGYRPKPEDASKPGGFDEDYRPRPVEDKSEYVPKPGGYRPNPGSEGSHRKIDHGGYEIPKGHDYEYGEGGDDGSSIEEKPIPQVDRNCICVPYYQCEDGHIVTDGAGIIDARKRPEPEEDLPLDGKFQPPSCGPFHVCCSTPESSTVKPYEHRCGVRNPSGINSRILSPSNKGEADFGEWPWQAAVLKAEGKVNIFQCGGVLIDKFHVLTVAHCVFHLYQYNEYPLKVRLGEWDTQTTTEFLAHEDYKVNKIFIHPEYKNTSLWNDLAILRLEEPVLFAPHIDTICLPQYDEIFAEQNCVVTGWGKDAYKGGSFSNVMKEVAIQVIDNYKCEEMLRKTRLGRFFQLHDGFLCAGGEYGLDSCKGDGGGPLVCYRKDKSYALAGIVSWGIDCGQPGVPGVYVKIQKFLDWISKSTGVSLQEYWPKRA